MAEATKRPRKRAPKKAPAAKKAATVKSPPNVPPKKTSARKAAPAKKAPAKKSAPAAVASSKRAYGDLAVGPSVMRMVEGLRSTGRLTLELEPLAELAMSLARTLDDCDTEARSKAGIAKELRATLADLMPEEPDAGDGAWDAGLSTPVRNATQP